MERIILYHNGVCSKSKGALELLEERNADYVVRYYMLEPLSRGELEALLLKLGMQPTAIIRRNEQLYKGEYEGKSFTENEWIDILVNNPELIERPIAEQGTVAIVARPPERIFELL